MLFYLAPIIIRGLLLTWRTTECKQNENAPKSKVIKCTNFYRKRKPLPCLFIFGTKNLH